MQRLDFSNRVDLIVFKQIGRNSQIRFKGINLNFEKNLKSEEVGKIFHDFLSCFSKKSFSESYPQNVVFFYTGLIGSSLHKKND